MNIVAGIYRLAIAFFCLAGTHETWLLGEWKNLCFFTHETNIVLGLVMVWAGFASLLDGRQPPAWLKGCLTLYIAITGLVAWLVLEPAVIGPDTARVLGIPCVWMVHIIAPIMACLDFVLFDAHRRFRWQYTLTWLIYFPFYLAFVLVRAALWPHSALDGASPYPYPFVDVAQIGWAQLGVNIVIYLAVFFLLGLVLFLIDKVLPAKPPLGGAKR